MTDNTKPRNILAMTDQSLDPVMAQVRAIQALQDNGLNLFVFNPISTKEEAAQARNLLERLENEVDAQEDKTGDRSNQEATLDTLQMLQEHLDMAIEQWEEDEGDFGEEHE